MNLYAITNFVLSERLHGDWTAVERYYHANNLFQLKTVQCAYCHRTADLVPDGNPGSGILVCYHCSPTDEFGNPLEPIVEQDMKEDPELSKYGL